MIAWLIQDSIIIMIANIFNGPYIVLGTVTVSLYILTHLHPIWQIYEVDTIIHILHMRKLRHRWASNLFKDTINQVINSN